MRFPRFFSSTRKLSPKRARHATTQTDEVLTFHEVPSLSQTKMRLTEAEYSTLAGIIAGAPVRLLASVA